MENLLTQLKRYTTVVADTGDFEAIEKYHPEDATTNPSLVLKALSKPSGETLIAQAAQWAKERGEDRRTQLDDAGDWLAVQIGSQLLELIPGRVSTEVDARLSFDTQASVARARKLIDLYGSRGIARDRILIKLASTWQGIRAAEILQAEGILCNLTLLFSFAQARACAEAGVYLISPFVGRILDWYKKNTGLEYSATEDPGVISVSQIFRYFKQHDYATVVMGASFRNKEEVLALAGCDRLTISPPLLEELAQTTAALKPALVNGHEGLPRPAALTEAEFLYQHNQDAMGVEKLAEGIRNFVADQELLEQRIAEKL
jgi:transaldolase